MTSETAVPRDAYQSKVKPYKAEPPCHVGMVCILKVKKMRLYVGARQAALVNAGWALRVDLSNTASPAPLRVTATEPAKAFFDAEIFTPAPLPVLEIAWPDQRAPRLTVDWWARFAANLAKIDGDVAMHCMGGHGRTGTATAILIKLYKSWKTKKEPDIVTYLRKHYCAEAVETNDQLDYLELFDIITCEHGSDYFKPLPSVLAGAGSKLDETYTGGKYSDFWLDSGQ